MSYRKIGGLHFVRIYRLGFSFYWSKRTAAVRNHPTQAQVFAALRRA